MKNQELVDYLKECGVCQICQLRYLKARGTEYRDMKESFERLNVKYEAPDADEDVSKRARRSDCSTCLGLFSSHFQTVLMQGIMASDIDKFECDQIVVAISMPMLPNICQLSMWFALQRKFGGIIESGRAPDVPLKEAIKLILNPSICEQLKKQYDVNGQGLMININLSHSEEDVTLKRLAQLNAAAFAGANGKKAPEISRGLLDKQYTPARIESKVFEKYLPIPPAIPSESLRLESVTLTGPTVFVAGRYRKVTRDLSHTPWILNGKRVMDDSIEEIIMRSVVPYFCSEQSKVIFMSSGREDVDVRCLGKGRPFVLEIPNSRRTTIDKNDAHKMEQEIEKSLKVSVHNLQMVQREELVHIKTGEEKKRKYYRALCKLNEPVTVEILEKLNQPKGFEIQQKTPIRVLHRRALHPRPRSIYSLKACVKRDNPRLLVLDIVSQAGTYIKELVHGEFGRTTPSIASIVGQPIDIIALDVVGIDLEWPADVDNSV